MIVVFCFLLIQSVFSEPKKSKPVSLSPNFELKEITNYTEICFYSIDKNKCPPNINELNIFGPDEYNSQILSFSNNPVEIHIAEPIFLKKPLIFSSPVRFFIIGNQINGRIEVHAQTIIDIQDPTQTEINIYWSIKSKHISQINTLLPAKSIFIQVIDQIDNISAYNLPFYAGKETSISLSTAIFKKVKYSIRYKNNYYFVSLNSYKSTLNDNSVALLDSTSGNVGNLQYLLTNSSALLILNGTGAMNDFADASARPWDSCRNEIACVIIDDGITSIGNFAFSDCNNLVTITIPNSVTKIGNSAFRNCLNLWDITLSESIEYIGDNIFYNCSSISYIIIPPKVTQIPDYAFYNCTELFLLKIHEKVTSIGDYSFYCCVNLIDLTFSSEITTISSYSFYNCSSLKSFSISEKVESINDFAFYGTNFASISIHEKVTFIGTGAFSNCNNFDTFYISGSNSKYEFLSNFIISKSDNTLISYIPFKSKTETKLTIPEKVTSINDYAFYNQKNLTSVFIPENVKVIGNFSFSFCSSITELSIPESVTSINDYAFYFCTSLNQINLSENLVNIGDYAFYHCTSITELTLPNSITSINSYTFCQCKSLAQVEFPENLVSIGDYAFYECELLKEFSIPTTLKSIGTHSFLLCKAISNIKLDSNSEYFSIVDQALYILPSRDLVYYSSDSPSETFEVYSECTKISKYALSNCENLVSITMPDTVTIIDDYAFYKNIKLESIKLSNNLESIGKYAFSHCYRMKQIELPDNVNYIGDYAFYLAALNSIKIPDKTAFIGEYAFSATILEFINFSSSCYTDIKKNTFRDIIFLEEVNITENIKSIDPKAFFNCQVIKAINVIGDNTNFKSESGILYSRDGKHLVKFPPFKDTRKTGLQLLDTVTTIDEFAFSYSNYLDVVELPDTILNIKDGAFYNSLVKRFEGNLQNVGNYVFAYCNRLTNISLLTITKITDGLFYNCSQLEKLSFIGRDVKSVGNYAFCNCELLYTVDIPTDTEYIGKYAFYECRNLVFLNYHHSNYPNQGLADLKYIGDFAFYNCITFHPEIKSNCDYIGNYAFASCRTSRVNLYSKYIGVGAFQKCEVQFVELRCQGNVSYANDLFAYCPYLKAIFCYSDIRAIPNNFCVNCSYLKWFQTPNSVQYIGQSAFENCLSLDIFYILSDLKYIGPRAFAGCSELNNITYSGVIEPKYCSDSFLNANKMKVVTVTGKYSGLEFCGFHVWSDGKIFNENGTILKPPVYNYIYVDINESEIFDDVYHFDNYHYPVPNEREVVVLRLDYNKYKIKHVVVYNEIINHAGILIPKEYEELKITGKEEDVNYTINLITSGNSLDLSLSSFVYPRFNNTNGNITINCIDCVNDSILNIGLINPSSEQPFTLIPSHSTFVEEINFDKNNTELEILIDDPYSLKVQVKNITVQQFVNAKISDCQVKNRIQFGIGSSLFLDENVDLLESKINIPFNKDRKNLANSYLKGQLDGYPEFIYVNNALENAYLMDKNDNPNLKKIIIAESDKSFYCNAWLTNIRDKLDNSNNFRYECESEMINDTKIYRLLGIESNAKTKKKKSISTEMLFIIISSVIAFIVIVVSICVYFCVLRKNRRVSSAELP